MTSRPRSPCQWHLGQTFSVSVLLVARAVPHARSDSRKTARNTTQVTNPLGKVTANVFDALDRVTQTTDPETGVTGFGYDRLGNMTSLTDPEGNQTTFAFDGLGRLTSETNELGLSRLYGYDAVGNLVHQTDRNGRETEFDYNHLDLMVQERWLGPSLGERRFQRVCRGPVFDRSWAKSDNRGIPSHLVPQYAEGGTGRRHTGK